MIFHEINYPFWAPPFMETPDVHIAPGFSYGLMIVFVGFRTKISLKSQNGEVPWFDRFFLKETSFY